MRKGTIHVSDQFYHDNVQLAFYKCTSEYTFTGISVLTLTYSGYTYRIYIILYAY